MLLSIRVAQEVPVGAGSFNPPGAGGNGPHTVGPTADSWPADRDSAPLQRLLAPVLRPGESEA